MIVGSKKFQAIINHLVKISDCSTIRVHKHACALIKGGKIIQSSVNTISNRFIGHAEQMILHKYKKQHDLKKCMLMVIRVSKSQISDSKPCNNCLKRIQELGIKKVLYSTNNGYNVVSTDDLTNNHLSCHYKSNSNLKSHFLLKRNG
jgi:deoxycytidylate deaminase